MSVDDGPRMIFRRSGHSGVVTGLGPRSGLHKSLQIAGIDPEFRVVGPHQDRGSETSFYAVLSECWCHSVDNVVK